MKSVDVTKGIMILTDFFKEGQWYKINGGKSGEKYFKLSKTKILSVREGRLELIGHGFSIDQESRLTNFKNTSIIILGRWANDEILKFIEVDEKDIDIIYKNVLNRMYENFKSVLKS